MDLRPRRDYIYLNDLLEACLLSMEKPFGIYNLGSGYSKSVKEIMEMVFQYSGISKDIRVKGNDRPNEIFDLFADISLIKQKYQWVPETSFETGIRQCVDQHKRQGS